MASTRERLSEKPVGTCPACGESVFNSREGDAGPVWTCPADLAPENPWYQPTQLSAAEIRENERAGFFSLCAEEGERAAGCYDRLPLHGACYDKGNY